MLMGFLRLAECQTGSKRKAFRIQKIARSPVHKLVQWNKMEGAGVCLKNCNAGSGESASPQTKVRIRQTKFVELVDKRNCSEVFKVRGQHDKR